MVDAELTHAVADLDGPPHVEPEAPPAYSAISESHGTDSRSDAPVHAEAEPPREPQPPQAAASEPPPEAPPRRRSTVREPVPQTFSDHAAGQQSPGNEGDLAAPAPVPSAPAAEPIVVSNSADGEASDRPRRAGWWSKRALGKG
jgi:ribonuclease E